MSTAAPSLASTHPRAGRAPSLARWRHLPRESRDTLFLLAVIAWTLLPHVSHVPWWCIVITVGVLVWRASLAWQSKPLPSLLVRTVVLALAVGLTWWSYRTIFGKEPGVTLLVMLMVIKALEARVRRDAFVMFFLGFFIVITNFFFSQSIPIAIAMILSVWGLLTALVLAHLPTGKPPIAQAGGTAARAALLGLPVMLLLFFLFPRIGPLWGSSEDTNAKTGLSGSLRMGGVIELISDERIAMRVKFDGPMPPTSELYFRGPVLTRFDGREWFRERGRMFDLSPSPRGVIGNRLPAYAYELMVEPNHLPLLPLLEGTLDDEASRPRARSPNDPLLARYAPRLREDLQWATERPIDTLLGLRAAAYANLRQGPFSDDGSLREHLALPEGYNPRTRAWAQALFAVQPELREQGAPAIIEAILRHINAGFTYTLTPGTYGDETGRHAVDEFWFDRRQGFCEHYATAMVVILRTLGVPARIVTGYQGTDPEPQDGWLVVRQANAHAWVEVWAPGQGWFRVDPTSAVAPERIAQGRTLQPRRGVIAGAFATIDPALLPTLRRFYERIEHRWNQWVVKYSRGQQYELLGKLGIDNPDWAHLGYALAYMVCGLGLAGSLWAWLDRRRRDPWERLQARVRDALRDLGLVAGVHEAPRTLARRVRAEFGHAGHDLAAALEALDHVRYASPHAAVRPDPAWWRRFASALRAARA